MFYNFFEIVYFSIAGISIWYWEGYFRVYKIVYEKYVVWCLVRCWWEVVGEGLRVRFYDGWG